MQSQSNLSRKGNEARVGDIVDQATRSRMMSGIRGKDTRPEIEVRKALHAKGFRYRLHARDVPGKPDATFPRYRAALFVNGCFWHGHDCHLFRLPGTRTEFWQEKIARNQKRDEIVRAQLREKGWRSITIWECAIRGRESMGLRRVVSEVSAWLRSSSETLEIRGAANGNR